MADIGSPGHLESVLLYTRMCSRGKAIRSIGIYVCTKVKFEQTILFGSALKKICGETAELPHVEDMPLCRTTASRVTCKLQDKSSAKDAQCKSVSKVLF